MNIALQTGWIHSGDVAWVPASGATPARRKLIFELMVHQPDGSDMPWACEVTDDDLITRYVPLVTPGRAVIVQAELRGRPFQQQGIQKGWVRYLHVLRAEFPERSKPKVEAAEAVA